MEKYIFLEHTADIKFRAFGKDLNEVFTNSAMALAESIAPEIQVKEKIKIPLKMKLKKSSDMKRILYDFLEEFLYLLDTQGFLLSKVSLLKIDEKNNELNAEISGDDAKNYSFSNEVKAITYNDMVLEKTKKGWIAEVVLDV